MADPVSYTHLDVYKRQDLRVSRSLRRSCARLQVTVDTAFDAVVRGCADPDREGRWITRPVTRAYTRLHALCLLYTSRCV